MLRRYNFVVKLNAVIPWNINSIKQTAITIIIFCLVRSCIISSIFVVWLIIVTNDFAPIRKDSAYSSMLDVSAFVIGLWVDYYYLFMIYKEVLLYCV